MLAAGRRFPHNVRVRGRTLRFRGTDRMSNADADERERQTRKRRIDPKLKARGWTVVAADKPRMSTPEAITEYETDRGPADYALRVDDRILGVVEAKRLTVGPQNSLTQAERYSRGVTDSPFNFDGFRVPFLYSTNGEVIWFHDVRHPMNRSRRIADFHTPQALREMLERDFEAECRWLAAAPNNAAQAGRPSASAIWMA